MTGEKEARKWSQVKETDSSSFLLAKVCLCLPVRRCNRFKEPVSERGREKKE